MILGKVISGPSFGDGLGAYSEGSDFNCNSTICYGVTKPGEQSPGSVHQVFMGLQRAINRWSGAGKFTPVAVDGKIGHATVTALQKAGSASLSVLPMGIKQVAQALFNQSLTKENTAINALGLTENLNAAADKREAAGTLPAPLPSAPSLPSLPAPSFPPASPADFPAPTGGSKSNTLYWVLGGFAVVAAAGITTAVVLKKKGSSRRSGRSGAYPRRRRAAA